MDDVRPIIASGDVTIYGPARYDEELDRVHWVGSVVRKPGIPTTNNPHEVTCVSCKRTAMATLKQP